MSRLGRLALPASALVVILVVAVLGYHRLMGWGVVQSLFFSLITITTIGYSDYHLTPPAMIFTAVLIVFGLLFWTLLLAAAVEYAAASWHLRGRWWMEHELARLEGHYIVVGHGAVGREVVKWLRRAGRQVLVVDSNPQAVEEARAAGLLALEGDATEEATLERAGLHRAAAILPVTRNDPVNVFVTLTARAMRPDIYIAANGIAPGADAKLRRAGATVAVSPYDIGAQRLAMAAVSPHVAEMLAGYGDECQAGLMLREAEVEPGSKVAGKSLRESGLRDEAGVLVAALRDVETGQIVVNPTPDRILKQGDILIGFGVHDQMARFVQIVSPAAARELRPLDNA